MSKKFPFGKKKGMEIGEVLSDSKYVIWLKGTVPDTDLKYKWDILNEVNEAYNKIVGLKKEDDGKRRKGS